MKLLNQKDAIGKALYELALKHDNLRIVVADVGERIFIKNISEKWPEKVIDVGIAEQNMIGIAAALADEGYIVFAVSYAPFIIDRVLDQVRVFLGIMKCNVKLIGLNAGFGGADLGATHTSFDDIGAICSISNINVYSPSNRYNTYGLINEIYNNNNPTYLRITEDNISCKEEEIKNYTIPRKIYGNSKKYAILCNGSLLNNAIDACELLIKDNINISIYDFPTIRPFNLDFFKNNKFELVFTLEEHNIVGGFGANILQMLNSSSSNSKLVCLGINDRFFSPNRRTELIKESKLDALSIANKIKEYIK